MEMDQILGQSRALDVLQAALTSGRLHHAYIFHGPWGVGKFTTALAFAKILLCHQPQTDLAGRTLACNACPSCAYFAPRPTPEGRDRKGNADEEDAILGHPHPDLHIVVKELARYHEERVIRERKLMTIPIDILRDYVIRPATLASQMGHHKVIVIDEAHLMATVGQDALLKTLEEPPLGTFLILVTTNEDKLAVTVRSRCQRVGFTPLVSEIVENYIARYAPGLAGTDRDWLVHFAGGSLGRAQLAVDHDLARWAREVLPAVDEMAQGRFPARLGQTIAGLIDDFAKGWVSSHKNASKEAANKQAAGLMWSMISQHVRRRLARLAESFPPGAVEAAEASLEPWIGVIDALSEAEAQLESNVNLGLVADHLVTRMHRSLARAALVPAR